MNITLSQIMEAVILLCVIAAVLIIRKVGPKGWKDFRSGKRGRRK